MLRYPLSSAIPTVRAVSSGGTWYTPKPSEGMVTPLCRVVATTLAMKLRSSDRQVPESSHQTARASQAAQVLRGDLVGGEEGFHGQLGERDVECGAESGHRAEEAQLGVPVHCAQSQWHENRAGVRQS